MPKRGRPAKYNVLVGQVSYRAMDEQVLYRTIWVLYHYNDFRRKGQKHSAAIDETVSTLASKYKISATVVKRILAAWQPRNARFVLCANKRIDEEFILPDGQRARSIMIVGIAMRPNYPRHNGRRCSAESSGLFSKDSRMSRPKR